MLLQVQNFRLWMKSKLGQRGAAMTEYAIILAFVAAVAAVVFSSKDVSAGLGGAIKTAINKAIDQLGGSQIK